MKLDLVQELGNAFGRYVMAAKIKLQTGLVTIVVDHLPKEISRVTFSTISKGAAVEAAVNDSHHCRSPAIPRGFESPIRVSV